MESAPSRPLRWLLTALSGLVRVLLVAWAALAIYYSNLPWAWLRTALAVAFVAFGIWALWLSRRRSPTRPGGKLRGNLAFAAAFLVVLAWWLSIRPSHDRPWRPEVAVMPRAIIEGDHVRMTGFRDFDYRSRDDFTVRHEDREFLMSRVTSLDLFISYWHVGPVAHTFVSFNFDDGTPPLCISIETRPEIGEGFSPIASLFKQFELIYVVGSEEDLVGSRAVHRGEEVFLYPIRTSSPEAVRRLLGVYLDRINELADRPEFYHLLSSSCMVNIVRYAGVAGREGRFDLRHLLNGWVDRYLYEAGWVDTTLPFAELRQRSRITDVVKAADGAPDFSRRIRASGR